MENRTVVKRRSAKWENYRCQTKQNLTELQLNTFYRITNTKINSKADKSKSRQCINWKKYPMRLDILRRRLLSVRASGQWSKSSWPLIRFSNWQCVVVSLGKTLYANFYLEPGSLPVVVAQPDKKTCKLNPKKCTALLWLDRRRRPSSNERVSRSKKKTIILNIETLIIHILRGAHCSYSDFHPQAHWPFFCRVAKIHQKRFLSG